MTFDIILIGFTLAVLALAAIRMIASERRYVRRMRELDREVAEARALRDRLRAERDQLRAGLAMIDDETA